MHTYLLDPLAKLDFARSCSAPPISESCSAECKVAWEASEGFVLLDHCVLDKLFLHASNDRRRSREILQDKSSVIYFDGRMGYCAFRDDFGPMHLGSIFEFLNIIDNKMHLNSDQALTVVSDISRRPITNVIFLLGSYLILNVEMHPDEVAQSFDSLRKFTCPFRDVCPGPSTFDLELVDCWAGLWRAKTCGWVDRCMHTFDAQDYEYLADPQNADLHEIVPGKLIAMRGPKGLHPTEPWRDAGNEGQVIREFSPGHMLSVLRPLGVTVVVRLNRPEYDKAVFEEAGMGFVDLYFEDCSCPPTSVVAKFLRIVESVPGAVAVHCRSGLGRTGTLIALYMMRRHGFSAREAMGWLRIVRPGCVMGPQQRYLLEREAVMWRTGASRDRDPGPSHQDAGAHAEAQGAAAGGPPPEPARPVQEIVDDAVASVDQRMQAAALRRLKKSASDSAAH